MELGEPQMSDLSMDEMRTEASAEAPVTETDYTGEMAQTYDRVNSQILSSRTSLTNKS